MYFHNSSCIKIVIKIIEMKELKLQYTLTITIWADFLINHYHVKNIGSVIQSWNLSFSTTKGISILWGGVRI